MEVKTFTVYRGTEILNRPNGWEGIAFTAKFDSVVDEIDGVKVVKAGTPLKLTWEGNILYGEKVSSDADGILLSDVFEGRPIGTALKKAYINKNRAEEHSGATLDASALSALPMIVVE